jgi:FkbM family methyltransferase
MTMLRVDRAIKALARRVGIDVQRYRAVEMRRQRLLQMHGIDVVLDVGANVGQYARALREFAYPGRILSFEPLPEAFEILQSLAGTDSQWDVYPLALGAENRDAQLNVAESHASSSLLRATDRLTLVMPPTVQVDSETVPIARLDSLKLSLGGHRTLLKLDVQGSELEVLKGGRETLADVNLVECELSIAELYDGQPLFADVLIYLRDADYELVALEPGFYDPVTGENLQFDGTFAKIQRT